MGLDLDQQAHLAQAAFFCDVPSSLGHGDMGTVIYQ